MPRFGTTYPGPRLKTRMKRERDRDVWRLVDLHRAGESWGSYADECNRNFIDLNGFAEDCGIASKTIFPIAIRNDRDRLGGRLVIGDGERATQCCHYSERRVI